MGQRTCMHPTASLCLSLLTRNTGTITLLADSVSVSNGITNNEHSLLHSQFPESDSCYSYIIIFIGSCSLARIRRRNKNTQVSGRHPCACEWLQMMEGTQRALSKRGVHGESQGHVLSRTGSTPRIRNSDPMRALPPFLSLSGCVTKCHRRGSL